MVIVMLDDDNDGGMWVVEIYRTCTARSHFLALFSQDGFRSLLCTCPPDTINPTIPETGVTSTAQVVQAGGQALAWLAG
jgi:hypothetical protein